MQDRTPGEHQHTLGLMIIMMMMVVCVCVWARSRLKFSSKLAPVLNGSDVRSQVVYGVADTRPVRTTGAHKYNHIL